MEMSTYGARSPPGAALASPNGQPFIDLDDAHPLAQAIVDTIRDPPWFLVVSRVFRTFGLGWAAPGTDSSGDGTSHLLVLQ
jgi:hypothetical protein